eukprot:3977432-Pyramimonas_sp.AAC.1
MRVFGCLRHGIRVGGYIDGYIYPRMPYTRGCCIRARLSNRYYREKRSMGIWSQSNSLQLHAWAVQWRTRACGCESEAT